MGWWGAGVVVGVGGGVGVGVTSDPPTLAQQIAATREKHVTLVPGALGSGRDYFDQMFNDLQVGIMAGV